MSYRRQLERDLVQLIIQQGDFAVTHSRKKVRGGPNFLAGTSSNISRLFGRVYWVDASRQESSEGTGLGLAISKSIIDLHGGTIAVRSDNGMTRFEIRLPYDQTTRKQRTAD